LRFRISCTPWITMKGSKPTSPSSVASSIEWTARIINLSSGKFANRLFSICM